MAGAIEVSNEARMFIVRFLGDYNDEEFAAYLHALEGMMARGLNECGLYVTEQSARLPSHRHLRRQAEWMKRHSGQMQATSKVAFVLPSALLRGALRVVFRFEPSPVQYRVFRDEDEARAWLQA